MGRTVNRRGFLTTAAAGTAALGLTGWKVDAAEMTDEEKRNVKVLEEFLTARWTVPFNAEKIGAFLADDIRVRGKKAILDELTAGYKDTESADFKMVNVWARGMLVMNERIEHTK